MTSHVRMQCDVMSLKIVGMSLIQPSSKYEGQTANHSPTFCPFLFCPFLLIAFFLLLHHKLPFIVTSFVVFLVVAVATVRALTRVTSRREQQLAFVFSLDVDSAVTTQGEWCDLIVLFAATQTPQHAVATLLCSRDHEKQALKFYEKYYNKLSPSVMS